MTRLFAKVPALPATVGLCAGILLSTDVFPDLTGSSAWICLIMAIVLGSLTIKLTKTAVFGLGIVSAGIGMVICTLGRTPQLPDYLADQHGTAEGTVIKAERTEETTRLVVDVTSWVPKGTDSINHVDFRILCTVRDFNDNLVPGVRLKMTGRLSPLSKDSDIPYQTDFNRYLKIEGVSGRMITYKDDYGIVDSNAPWLDRFTARCTKAWQSAICDAGFDEETTCFILAVIGGNDLLLSEDLEEDFRNTGLAHILAISGLHVGIIILILAFLLYPVKLAARGRNIYFILTGVAVIFYAVVSGGSPSAWRAAVMCCVLMGYRMLEVRANPFQSLSVAVYLLLIVNPLWFYLPGFRLSVCAVLAIITFGPALDFIPRRFRFLRFAWMTIILPLIAVIGTLAPTVFYFHSISLNFWISNIAGALFVPLLVASGFVSSLLALVGLSPGVLADFTDTLYSLLHNLVTYLSNAFPDSRLPVFMSAAGALGLCASVFCVGWLIRNYSPRRMAATLSVVLVIFIATADTGEALPASELYVPRHYGTTDVIIVHHNRGYIWTTASDKHSEADMRRNISTLYRDFLTNRGIGQDLPILNDGFDTPGLTRHGNTVTLNGRKITLVDNSELPDTDHVDIAIVSELYNGSMNRLVKVIDADTIILHTSINFSRHEKFVRQLDTLGVPYRSLRVAPVVWQFQ